MFGGSLRGLGEISRLTSEAMSIKKELSKLTLRFAPRTGFVLGLRLRASSSAHHNHRRLGRERLGRLFTGYRQRNEMIENVLDALEVEGHNVEDFVKWTRVDVRRLVSCFLGFRFPTVLACNKIDKANEGVLESLLGKLPMHGVQDGVGVCASNECEIVRRAIDGKDISDLEITENVWKTISKGISMSSTVFVFPVIDLSTCMSLPSMIRNVEGGGGSTSATAISENHKKSILARGEMR